MFPLLISLPVLVAGKCFTVLSISLPRILLWSQMRVVSLKVVILKYQFPKTNSKVYRRLWREEENSGEVGRRHI
jgi:hypothetical protein